MSHGEQPPSPQGANVKAVAGRTVAIGGRKKTRITFIVMDKDQAIDPLAPITIVQALDDTVPFKDITSAEGKKLVTVRRQYITRSRSLLVYDTLALPGNPKGKASIIDTIVVSLRRPSQPRLGVDNTSASDRDKPLRLSPT
ncbi:hypothetical protein NC652_014005 [Populus alba x Populus x berolinensis]|uniref:Uncharacterized protein n=3 Tax=Populus TaxID=3689 RepID=A0A4U5MX62_POPAL|nr:hypothetical protein NC652_014005 [Populus alba x Populus x berolinensis]KAJ6997572.1 hypothetical protein NC653_013973 [Populus alba x Populus x berolinensis]TKR74647.1 hypothetical protein D5086_0000293270 [Populus alba]